MKAAGRFARAFAFGAVIVGPALGVLMEGLDGAARVGPIEFLRIAAVTGLVVGIAYAGLPNLEALAERSPVKASVLNLTFIATVLVGFPYMAGTAYIAAFEGRSIAWVYGTLMGVGFLLGGIAKRMPP